MFQQMQPMDEQIESDDDEVWEVPDERLDVAEPQSDGARPNMPCVDVNTPRRSTRPNLGAIPKRIFAIGNVKTSEWYFDSGATCHMARAEQRFIDEEAMNHDVGTANNSSMKAIAKGSVSLNGSEGCVNVGSVLKIPDLATNLLSVSTICKRGHKMIFTADKCEVWDEDGELIITGVEDGGLCSVALIPNIA
nr:uncharacterized protein LOC115265158 [Aedes albopictus]